MADTSVAITAGSGTAIDTRTEGTNGNHRQVVVIGDPATNAGVAPVDVTNGLSVTLTTAIPAGTNAIGKLAANSGVDIGDVDITSIAAGDNNIGNVDIASAIPAGNNNIGDVDIASIAAGNNNIGDVDIASIAAGDNNIGNVDIVTMPNVTLAAGTNTNEVVGDVAHDSPIGGNPVRIGARADSALSGITLVADGDTTDIYAGLDGVLIVRPHANLEDMVSGNASNTDGTSTQVLAAAAAGIKHYITDVTITNTSSSNIYVELKDNTTVKWTFPVPANGGVTHHFAIPLGGTAATAWNFDPSAAATTVYCSVAGFKSKI